MFSLFLSIQRHMAMVKFCQSRRGQSHLCRRRSRVTVLTHLSHYLRVMTYFFLHHTDLYPRAEILLNTKEKYKLNMMITHWRIHEQTQDAH